MMISNILYSLLLFQSLVLAVYLLSQRRLVALPVFLILISFHMGLNITQKMAWAASFQNLVPGLALFYGPLIYFYLRELIYKDFRYHWKDSVHLLPGAVTFSLIAFEIEAIPFWPVILASLSGYIAASFFLIHRYHQVLVDTQSSVSNLKLAWAQRVLVAFVIIAILDTFAQMSQGSFEQFGNISHYLTIAALLGLVTHVIYKGIKYPQLFSGITMSDQAISRDAKTRYMNSTLEKKEKTRISKNLERLLAEKELYTEPRFSLQELATHLNAPVHHVSQTINETFNESFSDFINGYRVGKAKDLIKASSSAKTSLLNIGLDAGFNSKSAFNASFKKSTGMSPTEFREKHS